MKLNTILYSAERLYIQRLTPHYTKNYSLVELYLQDVYGGNNVITNVQLKVEMYRQQKKDIYN